MTYEFYGIEVDPQQRTLSKDGKTQECEPKVFSLLVYFCQHPQQAITREALITHVWEGRVVSDAAVNRAVGELRKLIEENPKSPKLIKTISKVGYSLVAEVSGSSDVDQTKRQEPEASQQESTSFSIYIALVLIALLAGVLTMVGDDDASNPVPTVVSRSPVTSMPGSAFNPHVHTVSQALYFLYRGSTDVPAQVFVQLGHNEPESVTQDTFYYTDVVTGPDGTVYASRLDDLQRRQCQIVKLTPSTKMVDVLHDCGKGVVTALAFDDRRNRIVFRSRPNITTPHSLFSLQLPKGSIQQLTNPVSVESGTGDYVYSMSPDGETLATVEYSGEGSDILKLIEPESGNELSRMPFVDAVYGLMWLNDDVLLASNSEGLYQFDIRDAKLDTIEHSDQFFRLAHGTETGLVLTERSSTRVNLYQYQFDTSDRRQLTNSTGTTLAPVSGNRSGILAYRSTRTGSMQIYIQIPGEVPVNTGFKDTVEFVSAMAWSGDDSHLVASINNTLYVYALSTAQWQEIKTSFEQVHYVTYVENDIIVSARVAGYWNLWKLTDGEAIQLTENGGYSAQGNGGELYYSKYEVPGLYHLDLRSGTESLLIQDFPVKLWRHWQYRKGTVYYLKDKTIRSFSIKTGEDKVLYEFTGRVPSGCSVLSTLTNFVCEQIEMSTSNIWQFRLTD